MLESLPYLGEFIHMTYTAYVLVSFANGRHNHAIHLKPAKAGDETLAYIVPIATGCSNHIETEFLDIDRYVEAAVIANQNCGVIQPIHDIELDHDDLSHLSQYRV